MQEMAQRRRYAPKPTMRTLLFLTLCCSACFAAGPQPAPSLPGHPFDLPSRPTGPGVPLIFEHSGEAGPDQTFFLAGESLTGEVSAWGVSSSNPGGEEIKPRVQFAMANQLAATLPERTQDGPVVVWVKNEAGFSEHFVLNTPQPWWCAYCPATRLVRVFGRNLAGRPDFRKAHVYVGQAGSPGFWAKESVGEGGKHEVSFRLPEKLQPGQYEVWVHAGTGGELGWGGPVKLQVRAEPARRVDARTVHPGGDIQQALDEAGAAGGGQVALESGEFTIPSTLRVPANVTLRGKSLMETVVRLVHDPSAGFPRLTASGWDQSPSAVHTVGDTLEYHLDVPKDGEWTVWLRYACEMSPWNMPGVSGHMTLAAGDGGPVPLMNLDNTGGFGTFKWSKSASIPLAAGRQKLVWKNVRGGGISLDAFAFALDPEFAPQADLPPKTGDGVLVLQGEDCTRFVSKEGKLPGGDRAAVWLAGDGAGVEKLTLLGNAQVNLGIAVRSLEPGKWLTGCRVQNVRVADCDGKQAENCGVHLRYVDGAEVAACELWGRAPVFISGARRSRITHNRLVSVTRFGGNAEAAILGRNETMEECIIEGNAVVSPPGAGAGGPTARRLIWISTGHGSVTHNWIAGNGSCGEAQSGHPRFGGVAGSEQNVGEMILFEANQRTMYFGGVAGADSQSVTLPKTIPPTPDDRLGSVKREHLAHDAEGNETPFWPPDADDGSAEPPIGEYYVSVMSGRGQGQTRRVLRREGERLLLDRPWRGPPQAGSVVAIGTGYYRNHVVDNHTADGMTGVQLWISCIENVVAGNTIARQRKPGLFLYANGTTLASSMPRTWNRGISPLFWNLVEGNRTDECSAGALVTSGDAPGLPIEFPRALGNVLRHNSFLRSRSDGVVLTSRRPSAEVADTAASIAGTIVEFNAVRDAAVAYRAGNSADAAVFRRNHAYFWYPVNNSPEPPVAFQVDGPGATIAVEQNTIEGIQGVADRAIVELRKAEGK